MHCPALAARRLAGLAALLAAAAVAQNPPLPPPGFSAPPVVVEAPHAAYVRSAVFAAPDTCVVAIGGELQLRRALALPWTLVQLPAGDDIAALVVKDALQATAPLAVQLLSLDAAGHASTASTDPGGYAASLTFQAAVLGASGSSDLGSTTLLTVSLLP